MNRPRPWTGPAFSMPNSKSIRRSASFGLLIATTAAALLCGSGAAHSGPCTSQIEELERQIGHGSSSAKSGPTAPQSIEAQLHHQPTPVAVQNAESQARADADAALRRAQKADTDGSAAACVIASEEAKHHWVGPAQLAFDGVLPPRPEFRPQGTTRVAVSFHVSRTSSSLSGAAPHMRPKHYLEGLAS